MQLTNEHDSIGILKNISSLSLRVNFLWSLLSLLIYNGCQFGLIMLLTRLGKPHLVGTFVLAMAVCAPFQIISSQLTGILVTDVMFEFSFKNYLMLALGGGLLLILGAALTTKFLNYSAEIMMIVLVIAVSKAIENLSYIFLGLMQMYERMDLFAVSLTLKGTLSLAVFWLLFHSSQNLLLSLLGMTAVGLLILISLDAPWGCKVGRQALLKHKGVSFKDLVKITQKTAPLSVSALLISLNTTVPRFFLEYYSGLKTLGYFGPIAYVLTFGDMAAAALGRTMAPRLARYWVLDRLSFRSSIKKLLALLAAVSLCASLVNLCFGAKILALLFRPDYAPFASVLFWLTVAMGFGATSQFFAFVLTAMRRLNALAVLSAVALLITTSLCYLLTPPFGLWGTAWAICLGLLFRFVGSYLIYLKIVFQRAP
jgi:O-antigen/teichoic acid export membrane protein